MPLLLHFCSPINYVSSGCLTLISHSLLTQKQILSEACCYVFATSLKAMKFYFSCVIHLAYFSVLLTEIEQKPD